MQRIISNIQQSFSQFNIYLAKNYPRLYDIQLPLLVVCFLIGFTLSVVAGLFTFPPSYQYHYSFKVTLLILVQLLLLCFPFALQIRKSIFAYKVWHIVLKEMAVLVSLFGVLFNIWVFTNIYQEKITIGYEAEDFVEQYFAAYQDSISNDYMSGLFYYALQDYEYGEIDCWELNNKHVGSIYESIHKVHHDHPIPEYIKKQFLVYTYAASGKTELMLEGKVEIVPHSYNENVPVIDCLDMEFLDEDFMALVPEVEKEVTDFYTRSGYFTREFIRSDTRSITDLIAPKLSEQDPHYYEYLLKMELGYGYFKGALTDFFDYRLYSILGYEEIVYENYDHPGQATVKIMQMPAPDAKAIVDKLRPNRLEVAHRTLLIPTFVIGLISILIFIVCNYGVRHFFRSCLIAIVTGILSALVLWLMVYLLTPVYDQVRLEVHFGSIDDFIGIQGLLIITGLVVFLVLLGAQKILKPSKAISKSILSSFLIILCLMGIFLGLLTHHEGGIYDTYFSHETGEELQCTFSATSLYLILHGTTIITFCFIMLGGWLAVFRINKDIYDPD